LTTIDDERAYKSREEEKPETQQDMQTIPDPQVSFLTKLVGLTHARLYISFAELAREPDGIV
jgi:hypothetical protein